MYIGTTQILEQFVGDTPIKSIWLGATKVWEHTYDYAISNVKLVYSNGGTYLKCDGSNYACVQCTLTKKIGTTIKDSSTKNMNITWNYPNVGAYFKVNDDGKIYFDVDELGTTDMSYLNNPITTSISPYLNGISGETVYLKAEPNVETNSTYAGYDIHANDVEPLKYYSTQFSSYITCYKVYKTYYKSGKQGERKQETNWYLYNAAVSTGPFITSGSSGTRAYVNCPANTNTYPLIRHYRVGYIGVTQEDVETDQTPPYSVSSYDYYLDVLQHSSNNYPEGTTQVLYYGSTKLTDDYTIQTSDDIIIANDAHNDSIVYEFDSSDTTLTITQKNGIIYIKGVDSNTDAWFEVTTYIPIEKEEWWMDAPEPKKTTLLYNIYGA